MALTGFDESQLIPVDELGFDESQLIPVEEPEIKPPAVDMGIPQIGTLPNISRGYSVPTTETVSTPTEILPPEPSMFQRALAAYKMTAKPLQEDINQLQQYSLGKATGLIKGVDAQTLANAVDVLKASGRLVDKGDFSAESWNQALGTPNRPPTRLEKILAGGQQAVAETADFFTTPLGIATLGVGGLPAYAQKAVTATFTADMAAKSPELYYEIQNAWRSGDTERLTKALVSAGLNTAFIAKGAKETFKGAKETFAPETVKPTEVPEAKPTEIPKTPEEKPAYTGRYVTSPEGEQLSSGHMQELKDDYKLGKVVEIENTETGKRELAFRTRTNMPMTKNELIVRANKMSSTGQIMRNDTALRPNERIVDSVNLGDLKTKQDIAKSDPLDVVDALKNATADEFQKQGYKGGQTSFSRDVGEQLRSPELIQKLRESAKESMAKDQQEMDAIDEQIKQAGPDVNKKMELIAKKTPLRLKMQAWNEMIESALNIYDYNQTGKIPKEQLPLLRNTAEKPFASTEEIDQWIKEHKTTEPTQAVEAPKPIVTSPTPTPPRIETKPTISEMPSLSPDLAKRLADRLNKMKLGESSGEMAGGLYGVTKLIWNGAIDAARGVLHAGGKIADAIEAAVKYIRERHKGKWDESGFRNKLKEVESAEEESAKPPVPPTKPPETVSTAPEAEKINLGNGVTAKVSYWDEGADVDYRDRTGMRVGTLKAGRLPDGRIAIESHALSDEARGFGHGQKVVQRLGDIFGEIVSDENPSESAAAMWLRLGAKKERIQVGDDIQWRYVYRVKKKGTVKPEQSVEPAAPPTPTTPESTSTAPGAEGARYGIAARVSEERAARGDIPGEPIRGPGITAPEAIERGRKLMAQGADPIKIMDDFDKTKAMSGDGMAVIRAHGENLYDAAVKAQKQFGRNSPEYKAAQKADYDWLQRVKKAQTEWHRMGQAQQGETDIDTGSFHGLQRAFFETTGRDFTPQQATKADKLAKTNQEATAVETKAKEDFYKAKDETVKTASDDAKKVWERAKSYIEKGEGSIDDIRHKVATDLGMPVSEVTRLLTETKQHKRMLDDVWKKQEQARRLRTLTKQWLKAQAIPGYLRALSNVPRILFGMKVAFHGTVALGTHAPMMLFQPPWWTTYFKNYYKMYRMVGSPAYFEMQMQDLMRNKNYITGRRAGLQTDPFQYEEYTDPKIAKAIGILTRSGTRGYGVLKLIRQDMFDTMWDRLPESDQTPDMAASMADGINHVTGVTKKGAPKGAHLALFAPRLMASRAMWLAGDPARAATTLLNWKNATKAEKQFAMNQLKEKAWVSGTLFALLAANQGFLKAIDSDQEVNFTDPNKSDFLKFKVAGMDAAYGNPMITMARLPSRMVKIRDGDTGKLKNVILPDAETYAMLLGYLRSQASPFAGLAADQWFMADYQNRPLPSSNRPVPKRLRQQGLGPYTWPEYLSETLSPIPFQEAIKEVWKTGLGMSDEQIRQYLKAFGTIAFQAGTGARVAEDTHVK